MNNSCWNKDFHLEGDTSLESLLLMENCELESDRLEEEMPRLRLQRDPVPVEGPPNNSGSRMYEEEAVVEPNSTSNVACVLDSAANGQAVYTELNYVGKLGDHYLNSLVNLLIALCAGPFLYPLILSRRSALFYRNIEIDGEPLKYSGKIGKACVLASLASLLAMGGLFCLFQQPFEQALYIGGGLLFFAWALVPFTVSEIVESDATAVSYRDVEFEYSGNWGFFLAKYFLLPLFGLGLLWGLWLMTGMQMSVVTVVVISSALLIPQKDYILSKLSFGKTITKFEGNKWLVSRIFKLPFIVGVAVNLLLLGFGYMLSTIGLFPSLDTFQSFDEDSLLSLGLFAIVFYGYVAVEGMYLFWARSYVDQARRRYYTENLLIGNIQLVCAYSAGKYLWLRLSNWAIRIFSAGILAPLATHRKQRYLVEHLAFVASSAKIQGTCKNAAKPSSFGLN